MAKKIGKKTSQKTSQKTSLPASQATGEIAPPHPAVAALATLIQQKQSLITDGSLQVLIAIASVSSLVTVDTSQTPAIVNPADITALTFGDPRVGLSDNQVAIFKANLKKLLPDIATDIDKIPDNAALNIGDVMDFVRLSILSAA